MPPPFSKEVLATLLLKSLFLERPWKGILQPTHDKQKQQPIKTTAHYTTPEDGILPGEITEVSLPMGKVNTSQMAIVSDGRRLSSLIPITAIFMEDKTNEIIITGSRNNLFSNRKILDSRDYKSLADPKRELSIQLLYDPGTNEEKTILDCSQLNRFLQYQHFKMEGVPALRHIIEKDNLMCKLDLKDAYVVVPIHPAFQQYLTFKHQEVVYQYKSMAFGPSVAPRVFTKMMHYALEPL
ncbi:hypothetical protein G6F57_013673 [Rhizopus arrhizus]|nr:hypothetical protein G6F23_011259 [Rhizopus arrhizus]KAG1410625.1 hypothetical protein G6F58_009017 [Rhizopus delemar]KAG0759988.1 hypothetical protein G6F24_008654 [Rhizopus arrhizus]KAG0779335.1 hypothetical protein G6F22_010691 [Rhizopus arrhizus]KAG0804808.1 hypothetical protein G6F20_012403 [Rhizopus arrhizus]